MGVIPIIIISVIVGVLGTGWLVYDAFVNFWDYFLEMPWFIKLLCPLFFLGGLFGGDCD